MAEEKKNFLKGLLVKGLTVAGVIGAEKLYDSFFKRYERPDYSINPGLYSYQDYVGKLPRSLIKIPSGKVELQGYYYECKKPKGLIIFVHGFHAGADDYLPAIEYLVKHNFNVLAYDGTGTFDSGGSSCVGMCQTIIDLDNVINFVQKSRELRRFPLFLIGHSCGGYAVSSILCIHKDIKAMACIAAVNNCYTLIVEKGYQYGGQMAAEGLPKEFLDIYQRQLFGKYCDYSGVEGINSVKIPCLVAHGLNDEVISFDAQSVISHQNEITNPEVSYYFGKGLQSGHTTVWHSEQSAKYQKVVDKELKKLGDDVEGKRNYLKTVDHYLYSEINFELFDRIIEMFNSKAKHGLFHLW